jgi:serine/threonine protein kinase
LGEDLGRFLAIQLIEQLKYIHDLGVIHRDIKLENIILDKFMNLRLLDFGYAANKSIDCLSSYRGTQSYMAPEIRLGKMYDGKEIDIFSMGVVIFTLVVGSFPFGKAHLEDHFYSCFLNSQADSDGVKTEYWRVLDSADLSLEFKDLMQKIFVIDGDRRPTLDQIINHPWLKNKMTSSKLG